MDDPFAAHAPALLDPARRAFAITPSDGVALATLPRAIFVGTGGTITLRAIDSAQDVVLRGLAAGQTVDIRAVFVRASGTTASDLVGLA